MTGSAEGPQNVILSHFYCKKKYQASQGVLLNKFHPPFKVKNTLFNTKFKKSKWKSASSLVLFSMNEESQNKVLNRFERAFKIPRNEAVVLMSLTWN